MESQPWNQAAPQTWPGPLVVNFPIEGNLWVVKPLHGEPSLEGRLPEAPLEPLWLRRRRLGCRAALDRAALPQLGLSQLGLPLLRPARSQPRLLLQHVRYSLSQLRERRRR